MSRAHSNQGKDDKDLPLVRFLIDTRDWAYDNIYHKINPGLKSRFRHDCLYITDYQDFGELLHDLLYKEKPDLIHIFWRTVLPDLISPNVVARCAVRRKNSPEEVLKDLSRCVLTTTVYDHLGLEESGVATSRQMLGLVEAYGTSSQILDQIYRQLPDMPRPAALLPDGIDLSFYHPEYLQRLTETERPFRIGWVGNSQWGLLEGYPDAKGLATILLPALEILRGRGINAQGDFVDRSKGWRAREDVARYYNTLDVLVCASLFEGTPNPVLEAMASGVPIVSSDVGIVRQILGPEQRRFIVERNAGAMADAIATILQTQGLREKLSAENLEFAPNHSWEKRYPLWLDFFDAALADRGEGWQDEKNQRLKTALITSRQSFKQKTRSFLRNNPRLYRATSKGYHNLQKAAGFFLIKGVPWIKRLFSRAGRPD